MIGQLLFQPVQQALIADIFGVEKSLDLLVIFKNFNGEVLFSPVFNARDPLGKGEALNPLEQVNVFIRLIIKTGDVFRIKERNPDIPVLEGDVELLAVHVGDMRQDRLFNLPEDRFILQFLSIGPGSCDFGSKRHFHRNQGYQRNVSKIADVYLLINVDLNNLPADDIYFRLKFADGF